MHRRVTGRLPEGYRSVLEGYRKCTGGLPEGTGGLPEGTGGLLEHMAGGLPGLIYIILSRVCEIYLN